MFEVFHSSLTGSSCFSGTQNYCQAGKNGGGYMVHRKEKIFLRDGQLHMTYHVGHHNIEIHHNIHETLALLLQHMKIKTNSRDDYTENCHLAW